VHKKKLKAGGKLPSRGILLWRSMLNFRHRKARLVAPSMKPKDAGELTIEDSIGLLTKAVLTLPPLMHYAAQSTFDEPTDPRGEGKMSGGDWALPIEKKLKNKAYALDWWMRLLVPPAYVIMWALLAIIYFGTGAMD